MATRAEPSRAEQPLEAMEAEFDRDIRRDDDTAARDRLARGLWITYCEDDTPPGHVVREYPDCRRELRRVEGGGASG